MKNKLTNEFFDINKLPKKEGILVFGISMTSIGNKQSGKKCFDYMKHFYNKATYPAIGLNFIYSDSLYLYSSEKASVLKKKFQELMLSHKFEYLNLIKNKPIYLPKALSFMTWSQTILGCKDFNNYLGNLKKMYKSDAKFRRYVNEDAKRTKTNPNTNDIDFILEEILMFYLISKKKVDMPNEHVPNNCGWVLMCYPGKPLKSEIYLFQNNFFKLKDASTNVFANCFYDLDEKKLYDYSRVDLETIEL